MVLKCAFALLRNLGTVLLASRNGGNLLLIQYFFGLMQFVFLLKAILVGALQNKKRWLVTAACLVVGRAQSDIFLAHLGHGKPQAAGPP